MPNLDLYIGNNSIIKLCSWMLVLFLFLNIRGAFQKGPRKGTGYVMLLIVMVLYCVFYAPITGDNFSSMQSYYAYLDGVDWENLHFERIYFHIMDLVPYGYVYYRFIVWGAACLLCVWLMKKLGFSAEIATISLLTFALPFLLYYQRAAFAYVLLYVALFCYLTEGKFLKNIPLLKRNYKLFSAGILLCTLPFHSTMPIYITLLLLALFVPKNKFGLFLLTIVFLIFSSSLLSSSISILKYFQEDTIETGLRSLENDTGIIGQNFNGSLGYFLHWLPLHCMLLYGLYKMIRTPEHLTNFEKVCLCNTLLLIVLSLLFIPYSYTIQIKFRNAAMMPWTLYIASYYMRYGGNRTCTLYALATIPASFI